MTDSDEPGEEEHERGSGPMVNRRDLLRGGTAAAALAAAASLSSREAQATHSAVEPFVQIGDPAIAYIDTISGDVILEAAASGARITYRSAEDDWQFNRPIVTDKLVIGGTLYELDGTIDVSATNSTTYNVSGSFKQIVVVGDQNNPGFNELQVNGVTSGYTSVDTADSETTGQSEWPINSAFEREYIWLGKRPAIDQINMRIALAGGGTAKTKRGESGAGGTDKDITSLTFKDSGAANRAMKAHVYGRVI